MGISNFLWKCGEQGVALMCRPLTGVSESLHSAFRWHPHRPKSQDSDCRPGRLMAEKLGRLATPGKGLGPDPGW